MSDLGLVLFGHRYRCMQRVRRTQPRGPARLILRTSTRDAYLMFTPRRGWKCVAIQRCPGQGWWTINEPGVG